jgi:hypothetical protein
MALLPLRLPFNLLQDRWASIINPVVSLPPNQGLLLKNVSLINGVTVVNHKLQRVQQGWVVIDQDAAASIHRSAPLNDLTLTLTSSAATTVALWVF